MVNINRASWMRAPSGWAQVENYYTMTEDQIKLNESLLADVNAIKS
jgi:hypothetical protein